MRAALVTIAAVLVAAIVPALLVTVSLRLVANDWIVWFEYAHGGVPDDRYGMTSDERSRLARVGLHAILPGGAGIGLLEQTLLPSGAPAFDEREISHMRDVRRIVVALFRVQVAAATLVLMLSVTLILGRHGRVLLRAWRAGGALTLAVAAAVGLFMLVAWSRFFEDFHGLLFEGSSWRFGETDTLRRLYPGELWMGVAAWISGLTVLLAAAVVAGATLLLRPSRLARE